MIIIQSPDLTESITLNCRLNKRTRDGDLLFHIHNNYKCIYYFDQYFTKFSSISLFT